MSFIEFNYDFMNNIRVDATLNHTDTADEFLSKSFELLHDINEITDPVPFYFGKQGRRNRSMQIDGYGFDDVDKSLILIINDFEDTLEPVNLINTQIDFLYKKLLNFLDEVCNGKIEDYCDASDDTIKLGKLIKYRMNAVESSPDLLLKVRFYILTNKKLSSKVKKLKQESFNEKPVELNIWHIDRFYEIDLQNNYEPIYIDLISDFNNNSIPCIKGDIGQNLGYSAYIAIIPGKLLADIYIEYGSRVLEGNIRAFLGTSGGKTVNSGIKKTIVTESTKFFTYNNGIATTASKIKYIETHGEMRITAIEDFQIINGGQTTATLAEAVLKKTNIALEGIFVPMKLTVIDDRESVEEDGTRFYDNMVEKIARYANSQNKVTAADFYSNNPFHVLLEKMSKKYLAPPVNGSPNPTGWYYERSKKKYLQEQMKMTNSEKDLFSRKFPKKQIINKEELAKYLYTLECKPDIVAKGKNWIIKDFGAAIDELYKKNKEKFNEFYFVKCIVAAIIFRTVDEYLDKLKRVPNAWYKVGGYKINIVPYSIAKIISSIPKGYSLDYQLIWQKQSLYPEFMREIEIVTKLTNDYINDSHGMIVTEYCKKKETWESFKNNVLYRPSSEFLNSLVPDIYVEEQSNQAKKDQRETNNLLLELRVAELGSEFWMKVMNEGNKQGLLNYKENSLLKIAIEIEKTGRMPLSAQAKAIMNIKTKIENEGIIIG